MNWMSDSSSIANAPSHSLYLYKGELGFEISFFFAKQHLIKSHKKVNTFLEASSSLCREIKNEYKHLDIVELSDLGKEPHICLCVLVVPELDGLSPVVAPLHHGSGLQMI